MPGLQNHLASSCFLQIAIALLYFSDAKAQAAANEMAGNSNRFQVVGAEIKARGLKYLLEGYW